jgi:hypothetical protein
MRPRAHAFVALVAVAASAACGGRVSGDPAADSGTSDGRASGSSSSSGSTVVVGSCPAEAPNVGDACFMPNQGCVYPYSSGACSAFVCDGSGHWVSSNEGC